VTKPILNVVALSGGKDSTALAPAGLAQLRGRFEAGHLPSKSRYQLNMFDDEDEVAGACRVCRM